MRRGKIINLGLIWNKACILLPTWYGNLITRAKREENKSYKKLQVNMQIKCIQLYPAAFILKWLTWDMDWALPLNPIVCRKVDRDYRYRTTFSPSTINRYFMEDPSRDKAILCGINPGYGYFSGGSFRDTERLSRSWLLPELFFCLCFFLLFNKRIL